MKTLDDAWRWVSTESAELAHPVLRKAAADAVSAIEVGSLARVLEPYKAEGRADLIEEVNQVRRYRNWVARGRRGEQPPAVAPRAAYDRLSRFLTTVIPAEPGFCAAPPPSVGAASRAAQRRGALAAGAAQVSPPRLSGPTPARWDCAEPGPTLQDAIALRLAGVRSIHPPPLLPEPGHVPCSRPLLSRRELVQAGGLAALGLSLPQLLHANESRASRRREKYCIFIFQYGELSQLDSWDPKPNAPAELREPYAPIATAVPGFHVGELMPRLVRNADKYAVIRSMTHPTPVHDVANAMLLAGNRKPAADDPAFGSVVAKLKPSAASVPSYVWLQKFGGGAMPPRRTPAHSAGPGSPRGSTSPASVTAPLFAAAPSANRSDTHGFPTFRNAISSGWNWANAVSFSSSHVTRPGWYATFTPAIPALRRSFSASSRASFSAAAAASAAA